MTSLVLLCSLLGNDAHELDPAQSNDHVAPGAVTASAEVVRFGGSRGQCGGIAEADLAVSATDDATPADKLGYLLELASGTPPRSFDLPSGAIRAADGELFVRYDADQSGAFTIDLSVRAVDLNGNLGPPTLVTVTDPGGSGCRATRGGDTMLLPLLAAFAWLARSARARATR